MEKNSIALTITKTIHIIFWAFMLIAPFVVKNRKMLAILAMILVLVYYSWLITEECPFTTLETYLGEKETTRENGARTSFISAALHEMGISKHTIHVGMTTIVALLIAVCLYRMV